MTHRIGNTIVFKVTDPEPCALCGKVAELRPYGPNGESICYDCGMANEPTTTQRMAAALGLPLQKPS